MKRASKPFIPCSSRFLTFSFALLVSASTTGCGNKDDEPKEKSSTGSDEDKKDKKNKESDSSKEGDTSSDEKKAEPKKVGDLCEKDDECESKKCREVSFTNPVTQTEQSSKTCAECSDDKECADAKKGIACVAVPKLSGTTTVVGTYRCGDGSAGYTCGEDKQCKDGLKCAAVTLSGKKSDLKTCGECASDEDCDSATPVCSTTGITELKPRNTCIAAGGKKDGETCSGENEAGDKECEHYCKSVAGIISLCVVCREDSHCKDGETCSQLKLNPTNPSASELPKCEPGKSTGF